ncbi:class I SAM-dependent methyltransferase (plasmid) [Coraliomargarita sp. W4R53]
MKLPKWDAYGAAAKYYDWTAGELVYRIGRVRGVQALAVRRGDTVLDLGCGTGMNFALLRDAVGPTGQVIGLDRSAEMLNVAARKVQRHNWENVSLVHADATAFGLSDLNTSSVDAVLSTYALSVVANPAAAWARTRSVLRPGARACVVDMQVPTGAAAIFAPRARLACALGGSDIEAHPWVYLEAEAQDVQRIGLRGGHIQVASGTMP